MDCASPEVSDELMGPTGENLFSTHSALVDALAREHAVRIVGP